MSKTALSDTLPKEKPSIRLDESDFPNLKNLKVDQEITITVKAKVTEIGRERWSNDKRLWGSFTVLSAKSDDGDLIAKGMDSVKIDKIAKR